jgi:hypothetical protein
VAEMDHERRNDGVRFGMNPERRYSHVRIHTVQ